MSEAGPRLQCFRSATPPPLRGEPLPSTRARSRPHARRQPRRHHDPRARACSARPTSSRARTRARRASCSQHYDIDTPRRASTSTTSTAARPSSWRGCRPARPSRCAPTPARRASRTPAFCSSAPPSRPASASRRCPGRRRSCPRSSRAACPCDRFVYEGFLPHKKGRQTRLKALADETRTVVLYESPHRLVKLLGELAEHCGPERPGGGRARDQQALRGDAPRDARRAGRALRRPGEGARRDRGRGRRRGLTACWPARARRSPAPSFTGAVRLHGRYLGPLPRAPRHASASAPARPRRRRWGPRRLRRTCRRPHRRRGAPCEATSPATASTWSTSGRRGATTRRPSWRRAVRGRRAPPGRHVHVRDALERRPRRASSTLRATHGIPDAARDVAVPAAAPERPRLVARPSGLPSTWTPTTWVFNRNGKLAYAFNYGEVSNALLAQAISRRPERLAPRLTL